MTERARLVEDGGGSIYSHARRRQCGDEEKKEEDMEE